MSNKIIFIDVDGPLAWGTWGTGRVELQAGSHLFTIPYKWVEEDCKALHTVLCETDARLVLSSDWRKHFSFIQMKRVFELHGIPGQWLIDTTTHQNLWKKLSRPPIEWERAAEIRKWAMDNKVKNWIAIDDMDIASQFKWMQVPHWRHVQVDGDSEVIGRMRDKVDECISKLNK